MNKPQFTVQKIFLLLLINLACRFLNYGIKQLQNFNSVPLYMDTLFTVTASLFCVWCGFISATVYHLCCVFPANWTADTLMQKHRSLPHNPDIANTFFRADFIEKYFI